MNIEQRLLDISKVLIVEAGEEVPENFDEIFNFLLDNNQIIFFIDQNDCVKGFVCYYRYGKRKRKYVKNMSLLYEYKKMCEGEYGYVPVAASRFDFVDNFLFMFGIFSEGIECKCNKMSSSVNACKIK
jgi:hypothetical protein